VQDRLLVGLELVGRGEDAVGLLAGVARQRRLGLARDRDREAARGLDLAIALRHRHDDDALVVAHLVAVGEVLGQEREPVVPVVADRLRGDHPLGKRLRGVEGLLRLGPCATRRGGDFDRWDLEVRAGNEEAQLFYTRMGYRPLLQLPGDVRVDLIGPQT
jgi:hypothetical protein